MDHERNEMDKLDEVMLPGFRFHPTDEELVGFYLKRKIQQRPLSIELIKQLDIYKYDPWDLPKLATTGEKEWYFYCPRDRKYRNSARPNRVTGAGFWKATGTDRPIYSSEGNKCIGLKKSLVFYKGRAAKGIKTDWMMHEFRLPSLTDSSLPPKRFLDKTIPANDSWAICRIFKKTNSAAQRVLSHSWVSPLPEPTSCDPQLLAKGSQTNGFSPHDMSLPTETSSAIQSNYNNISAVPHSSTATVTNFPSSHLDFSSYKTLNSLMFTNKPSLRHQVPPASASSFMFSPLETLVPTKCTTSVVDVSSILLNMPPSMLGDFSKASNECIDFGGSQQDQCNGFSFCSNNNFQQSMQGTSVITNEDQNVSLKNINISDTDDQQWPETVGNSNIGLAFNNLPVNMMGSDGWRPNLIWDSSSSPSDVSSTSFSTTKCYT